jgi:hypothetical protein
MKAILLSSLALITVLALASVAALIFFGIGNKPEVPLGWALSKTDIARARDIVHEGAKKRPDNINTLELSEQDLNLAANYLLNRYTQSAAVIELKNGKVRVKATMTLPNNAFGRYLNVSFRLASEQPGELPKITKFKAGKLWVPAKMAAFIIKQFIQRSVLNNYFILATRPIKSVRIDDQKVAIRYDSSSKTLLQARNFLSGAYNGDANNMEIYRQALIDIIERHDHHWRLSLADLLQPLFALAYQRSTLITAVAENRLVIFTVNDYVNKIEASRFLSSPLLSIKLKNYPVFLYKRIDLAQHFIASAAITASVSGQVAQAAGEEKELSDAQDGSGFSFIDLAADKAGTRFGETAVVSPESARKLQKAMAAVKHYDEFMPDPTRFPEKMTVSQFKARFESMNSPLYQALVKQIEAQIAALPIYASE